MKPGDVIWVRVFKADGSTHRWWQARVEAARDDCLITWTNAGNPVYHNADRFPRAVYHQPWAIRSYYWPGRRYDLLEVYHPDGQLHELYADITGPVEVIDGEVRFIDHELDVQMLAGGEPQIVDQDEFAEAAGQYGYSETFIRESYAQAETLLTLVREWEPAGGVARFDD
jgi:protein associated with RNAse G/E